MEERELAAIIEGEIASSIGYNSGNSGNSGDLGSARALELDYYNGLPYGNEVEGESQVVSSDVFDTVEGMLPSLLRIFTASDDVVRFEPNGPEDEDQAAQQTDVCNYVFYRQNNGFLILYEWFKDALIQKNGIVKYWWEDKESTVKETYKGMSDGQYRMLVQDDNVEVLEHEEYDDTVSIEQRDQMLAQPGLPPEKAQQIMSIPVPKMHDVTVRVKKDVSKICIETLPPEEFRISKKQKCISIQDTVFCSHETKMTVSALRELECPEEILLESGTSDNRLETSTESLARDRFLDERASETNEADDSMRELDVSDGFIRLDYDGDGVAELRHYIMVGNRIWINEESDHINFAAITPIIMPHRWIGKSAAELVMQDQFTKSVLWRQMLNNLYLTNNPRKTVLSTASGVVQANLDDLMNSRVGGIIREYVPNAVRHEETPFVAGATFPMLEYIDGQKEARTGVTRYNQGTDADSLNKTARGIQMIQTAGQARGDLIARIFAETGVKDLMRGIAYMLSKYSTKEMTVRLRNKWVDVDPRNWKSQFDMTVNVGLGTGNKDVQLAHLDRMGQSQMELIQTGRGYLVSDENVYNLYKRRAEAMGFKHPEVFVSDPQTVQKPPPQPNPEMIKIQAEADLGKAKIQSNETVRQFDAHMQKEVEQLKIEGLLAVTRLQEETKKEIERMRLASQAQIEVFKGNNNLNDEAKMLDVRQMKLDHAADILAIRNEVAAIKNKAHKPEARPS